ncbi:hypothetical protein C0991_000023 [Blastosporella zonata]|nr:hypothetical protein C0991_000023 [Blastosporella zonata]
MPSINDSKSVLVTGATSGIGRALALAIAELPSKPKVIAAGRRQSRLNELAKSDLATVQVDLDTDAQGLKAFVDEVLTKHPDLDTLILCAGVQHEFEFKDKVDLANIASEININYTSIVSLIALFLPHLLKLSADGRPCFIVPVTSGLAITPAPQIPNYSASKAALHSFSTSLQVQLRNTNVHVMEIIPPLVESELHDAYGTTEKLSKFWMPLDQYTNLTMEGLQNGESNITAGTVVDAIESDVHFSQLILNPPKMTRALWLRCETKEFERRAALTPTTSQTLINAGFRIIVERDQQRIFDDTEYEAVGCELVQNNSWPKAPKDIPIIGLKELEESTDPLPHTHIQFAHCYKKQGGWSKVLSRFHNGNGTLYDLEFLNDDTGRRVAAFGFHAGFAGAAAGALALAAQKKGEKLGLLTPFLNESDMVNTVKNLLGGSGKGVKALVIGALGRCGRGAVDLFRKIGLDENDIIKWDLDETKKGGPFDEILNVDIFVNCIYLSSKIPNFIDHKSILAAGKNRRLSVVVDVSCDTTNPFNPIPIYDINTTFSEPTVPVEVGSGNPPLSVISIDHLPTLLPREASEQFSADLLPSLLEFPTSRVWTDAEKLFREKLGEAVKAEGL